MAAGTSSASEMEKGALHPARQRKRYGTNINTISIREHAYIANIESHIAYWVTSIYPNPLPRSGSPNPTTKLSKLFPSPLYHYYFIFICSSPKTSPIALANTPIASPSRRQFKSLTHNICLFNHRIASMFIILFRVDSASMTCRQEVCSYHLTRPYQVSLCSENLS